MDRPRKYKNGSVAIFFDRSRQHVTSLEVGASLAHKNKIEILASNPRGAVLIGPVSLVSCTTRQNLDHRNAWF